MHDAEDEISETEISLNGHSVAIFNNFHFLIIMSSLPLSGRFCGDGADRQVDIEHAYNTYR